MAISPPGIASTHVKGLRPLSRPNTKCALSLSLSLSFSLSLSLSLRYNKLAELPASLCECTQLEEMSLESNSLQSLPELLFGSISKFTSIQLARNAFTNFPIVDPSHLQHINVSFSYDVMTM